MVCPVCPAVSVLGGCVGGYFGIAAPESQELRIASAIITSSLTCITTVALKCLYGFSLCDGNGNFSLFNITQVGVLSIVIGIIYSIAINCLLNLFFEQAADNQPPGLQNAGIHSCCLKV